MSHPITRVDQLRQQAGVDRAIGLVRAHAHKVQLSSANQLTVEAINGDVIPGADGANHHQAAALFAARDINDCALSNVDLSAGGGNFNPAAVRGERSWTRSSGVGVEASRARKAHSVAAQ